MPIHEIGGFTHENDFCSTLDAVERYSILGDTWIAVAKLPTARADKAMVTLEGHTLVIGGEKQIENKCELETPPSPGELTVAVDDIEVLNDDDSTWQKLDPLPEHRFRFAAVVHGNTIYTFGGQEAYDEGCNCMKTTDEVVTYVDKNFVAEEEPAAGEGAAGEGTATAEGPATTTDGESEIPASSDDTVSAAVTAYGVRASLLVLLVAFFC